MKGWGFEVICEARRALALGPKGAACVENEGVDITVLSQKLALGDRAG